jgi:hypothetical protein
VRKIICELPGSTGIAQRCLDLGLPLEIVSPTSANQLEAFTRLFTLARENRLKIPVVADVLIHELRTLRHSISETGHNRFSASSGQHDDTVFALAWSLFALRDLPSPGPVPGREEVEQVRLAALKAEEAESFKKLRGGGRAAIEEYNRISRERQALEKAIKEKLDASTDRLIYFGRGQRPAAPVECKPEPKIWLGNPLPDQDAPDLVLVKALKRFVGDGGREFKPGETFRVSRQRAEQLRDCGLVIVVVFEEPSPQFLVP